jgi:hypothetical protein
MRRAGVSLATALVLAAGPQVQAQTVRLGVHAIGLTYAEIRAADRVSGAGVGGTLRVRLGRLGADLSGYTARLASADGGGKAFTLLAGDARVHYRVARGLAFEVGWGRRQASPEFAAQDVGFGRAGILSELDLSRIGGVWGRGAYLIAPKFSGGGSAGLALELGVGAGLGTANGRVRGRVEYEFQRIDRTVGGTAVPIQLSLAKLGVDIGF